MEKIEKTNEKPSTAGIALKYGFFTAFVGIVFTIIIQLVGQANNPWLGLVSIAIMVLGIMIGINEYKNQNESYVSYGEGLGIGSLLCAVSGLITGIFNYVYLTFVDSSSLKEAIDFQRAEMERKGVAEHLIDQNIAFLEKFVYTPNGMFMMSLLGGIVIGFILSLIIAAVLKKDRTELGV